jgi:hypothetical protein
MERSSMTPFIKLTSAQQAKQLQQWRDSKRLSRLIAVIRRRNAQQIMLNLAYLRKMGHPDYQY